MAGIERGSGIATLTDREADLALEFILSDDQSALASRLVEGTFFPRFEDGLSTQIDAQVDVLHELSGDGVPLERLSDGRWKGLFELNRNGSTVSASLARRGAIIQHVTQKLTRPSISWPIYLSFDDEELVSAQVELGLGAYNVSDNVDGFRAAVFGFGEPVLTDVSSITVLSAPVPEPTAASSAVAAISLVCAAYWRRKHTDVNVFRRRRCPPVR